MPYRQEPYRNAFCPFPNVPATANFSILRQFATIFIRLITQYFVKFAAKYKKATGK